MSETRVVREVVLPVPPELVWLALTEEERLAEWFATEVALELRPGGEGIFRWDDGSVRRATIEELEPGHRLGFLWEDEEAGAASRVELELDEVPEGTRLTVVEEADAPQASAISLVGEWSGGVYLLSGPVAIAA